MDKAEAELERKRAELEAEIERKRAEAAAQLQEERTRLELERITAKTEHSEAAQSEIVELQQNVLEEKEVNVQSEANQSNENSSLNTNSLVASVCLLQLQSFICFV